MSLSSMTVVGLFAASVLVSVCWRPRSRCDSCSSPACKDEAFFDPAKKGMKDAARAMNVECLFTGTEGVDLRPRRKWCARRWPTATTASP